MTELLDLEQRLRAAVDAFPAPVRAELLRILQLPEEERAQAIGELYRWGAVPKLAELLIDLEEERAAKALVLGATRSTQVNAKDSRAKNVRSSVGSSVRPASFVRSGTS